MVAQEGDHAAAALKERDVRGEDHAVEALDVEGHVSLERLRHGWTTVPLRHRRHLPHWKGADSIPRRSEVPSGARTSLAELLREQLADDLRVRLPLRPAHHLPE